MGSNLAISRVLYDFRSSGVKTQLQEKIPEAQECLATLMYPNITPVNAIHQQEQLCKAVEDTRCYH